MALRKLLNQTIDEMELSVRSYNCLQAAGIKYIHELVSKEENQMLKYKNFGRKSLTELVEKLDSMGCILAWKLIKLWLKRASLMRHNKIGRKLGRKTAHRKALMSNLASALITHKRIKPTDAKAKELRMYIEPLVTFAKKGDLHSRRQVLKKIRHKSIVRELFDNIGPTFSNRNGGYTHYKTRF